PGRPGGRAAGRAVDGGAGTVGDGVRDGDAALRADAPPRPVDADPGAQRPPERRPGARALQRPDRLRLAPGHRLRRARLGGRRFGGAAPRAGPVGVAAVAHTSPFAPAVSATSGDLWRTAADATATYTPLTLAPGQSGTITVTFTPGGPAGTVVRGALELDTF